MKLSRRGWFIIGAGVLAYLGIAITVAVIGVRNDIPVLVLALSNYLVAAVTVGPAFALALCE